MKAEITQENKARFFAQYYHQKILHHVDYEDYCPVGFSEMLDINYYANNDYYLSLKSLSLISDEDLEAISFKFPNGNKSITIVFTPDNYIHHWKANNGQEGYLNVSDFDYLRSKGYALPWNGLSVEEMIESEWIKLLT